MYKYAAVIIIGYPQLRSPDLYHHITGLQAHKNIIIFQDLHAVFHTQLPVSAQVQIGLQVHKTAHDTLPMLCQNDHLTAIYELARRNMPETAFISWNG